VSLDGPWSPRNAALPIVAFGRCGRGFVLGSVVLALSCGGGDSTSPPSPDTTPPVVSIVEPIADTVAGAVTVSATASDNVGVVQVQFAVNGVPLGSPIKSPPYQASWNTVALPNGPFTITAAATDAAGNTATSAPRGLILRQVVSVDVLPAVDSFASLGDTITYTATAHDGGGQIVTGFAVTWTSFTPAVATVSSAGLLTTKVNGTTLIQAQIGAAFGTRNVTVQQRVARLVFLTQPAIVSAITKSFRVDLALQDARGAGVLNGSFPVTVSLLDSNATGATLLGTTSASSASGQVGFGGLGVTAYGRRFRIQASAGSITATSDTMMVVIGFNMVRPGGEHSCGIATSGPTYCWGANADGRLGDSTTTSRNAPHLVAGGHSFQQVYPGDSHTCGIDAAGDAYCWGGNALGQLGIGVSGGSQVPVLVSGGHTWLSLSVGAQHTCGIDAGGATLCWGDNSAGQLGTGATGGTANVPTSVAGGLTFGAISAGATHSCAIASDGYTYCWGSNAHGELGDSTTQPSAAPVQVLSSFGLNTIAAGRSFGCAISGNDNTYCWGDNSAGQLGIGAAGDRWVPTVVSTSSILAFLDAGGSHICGTVAFNALRQLCWGLGTSGQLGNGSGASSNVPVQVVGVPPLYNSSAGELHSCGRDDNEVAYCWGDGANGKLGNGGIAPVQLPSPVFPPIP